MGKKLMYIKMESYLVTKKDKLMSFSEEWMEVEIIPLSAISETCQVVWVFSHMWGLGKQREEMKVE